MNHVLAWLTAMSIIQLTIIDLFLSVPNYTLMEIKSHTQDLFKEKGMDLFKENLLFIPKKGYCVVSHDWLQGTKYACWI